MKIIVYCQHVLGVGHFFRTREIIKALNAHDVVLVTGGSRIPARLPDHVRHVELPGLMMDDTFSTLYSVDEGKTVDTVKQERQQQLLDLVRREAPDLFLVELYPFGRRAFGFELVPVLEHLRSSLKDHPCTVVCSLRDILVEKSDRQTYETRVIRALNHAFDAVLIHSDPEWVRLDDTFSQVAQIRIPLIYTGFITPFPDPAKVMEIRKQCGLQDDEKLIVASAGGGSVGAGLLKAAVAAFRHLPSCDRFFLKVFTGPYMDGADVAALKRSAGHRIVVEQFDPDFVSLLGAADLSVSMAGYNTCMNIVAARVPALVWPFDQNREQAQRARSLSGVAPIRILADADLAPIPLARLIERHCRLKGRSEVPGLNLSGADHTAKWVAETVQPAMERK